jgi:hypothetical protein
MMEVRDPYQVLGVSRAAARHQIRAAYVARARAAHPDLVGGRGLDVMRALNEAWDVLKDAEGASSATRDTDPNRPFWTGAMGSPPGRPSGPVLDDGIFAGWSIGEIARKDRGYLHWLRDRPEAKPIRQDIDRLLDPPADDSPSAGRRRR